MKSSASISKIVPTWLGTIFSRNYKDTSVVLFGYDDILLKTFLDIAETGAFEFLIRKGRPSQEELVDRWEEIVKENSKHGEGDQYEAYFQLYKGYQEIIANHTVIAACLEILWWKVDFNVIQEVRNRGFKIDTSSSEAYKKSLKSAITKSSNLKTKAEMKRKEIERRFSGKEQKSSGYWEIVGNLELGLERSITDSPETFTLAKYNELKKGVNERRRAAERRARANNRR
jgi:hypothetical protein